MQSPGAPTPGQANVGAGMVGDNPYESNVQAPAALSTASSGDGLVQSGVNPGAASANVAVAPNSGTTAGRGAATGGEAVAPEVRNNLNPSVNEALPAGQAYSAPGTSAPAGAPQMPGVQGGDGGGGGGQLAEPTVGNPQYSGGGTSQLPAPQAPDVPADFASSGGQQARTQLQADAQQLQQVGPAADAQIASEVAPQQQEGERSIWDSITSFFSGAFSSAESQSRQPKQQADSSFAQSAGQAASAVATAASTAASETARQGTMPVPAELSSRQNTIQQAVSGSEQNAQAMWTGGPQTQLPTGATQGVQQASQQVQQLAGSAQAPDVAGTVGAVTLPDHGLEPKSFEEVAGAQAQFDASQIPTGVPALGAAAGGGGDAMAQIAAAVAPKVEAQATPQYQKLVQQNTQKAQQAHQQAVQQGRDSFAMADSAAQAAIAQYEGVDPAAEAAPFDAQAQQAYQQAQQQAAQAATQMDGEFASQQAEYTGTVGGAQGEFSGQVDAARSSHSAAVRTAGSTYDQSVGAAEQTLQTGHNEAMGAYSGRAQSAQAGAQQTFQQENQAAQSAVQRHDGQMRTQLQTYRGNAEQVGNQAKSEFSSSFQQQQQQLSQQTQAQVQATQGQVDQQVSAGQQQVQQALQTGQAQADRAVAEGQSKAQQEANRANAEADKKRKEGEDRNFLEKARDAVVDFVAAALDWIKARFEEAKNAILNFLEQARQAALNFLKAAKDAALGILDKVKGLVKGLISALADALKSFISAFATFLRGLIDYFVNFIKAQIQAITDLINGLLEAFQQVVNAVVQGLVQVVSLINEDLGNKLKEASQVFLDRFNSVVDTAQATVQSASDSLQNAVQSAGDGLKDQVTQAEESLKQRIDEAEAALQAGVDAAYNAAVDFVNTAYEAATTVVNTAIDLAKKAVVAVIDAAYAAIEGVAKFYTTMITSVLDGLNTVGKWIGENIVGPLVEFLKDPWAGIRKMFVSFWNGPWRDVLLGIALGALIAVVTVATGGLGLIACAAITGLVVGASAATVYGAGEFAARQANVSLMQEGHTDMWDDGKPATIKGPDGKDIQVPKSIEDPITKQKLPNPALPENAWYFDTMGSARRNPNGSMSAPDPNNPGKFITLQPTDFSDPAKAADVERFMKAAINRDASGKPIGESMSDSGRSAGALAAQKGIEWGINGTVGALTGGGGGAALKQVGAQTFRQAATTTVRNAAISTVGDVGGAVVGERVNMAIEGYDAETIQKGATVQSLQDVAKVAATSFVSNVAGDAIGAGVTKGTTRVLGKNVTDAATGQVTKQLTGNGELVKDLVTAGANGLSGNVVNTAGEVFLGKQDPNDKRSPWERFQEQWEWKNVGTGAVQGFGSARANSMKLGSGGPDGQGRTLSEMAGAKSKYSSQNMPPDPKAAKPSTDVAPSSAPGHADPELVRPKGPEAPATTQVDAARKAPVDSQAVDSASPLAQAPTQARLDAAPKVKPESQVEVDAASVTATRPKPTTDEPAADARRSPSLEVDPQNRPLLPDDAGTTAARKPAADPEPATTRRPDDPEARTRKPESDDEGRAPTARPGEDVGVVKPKIGGNADSIDGTDFHGGHAPKVPITQDNVEAGLRTIGHGENMRRGEDGSLAVTIPHRAADGSDKPANVRIVLTESSDADLATRPNAKPAAAHFTEDPPGSGNFTVKVSKGMRPEDVSRAVAHELAEIGFGNQKGPNGFDGHHAGRLAELKVLQTEIAAMAPKPGERPSAEYLARTKDLDGLLDHLVKDATPQVVGMSKVKDDPNGALARQAMQEYKLIEEHRKTSIERREGDGAVVSQEGKAVSRDTWDAAFRESVRAGKKPADARLEADQAVKTRLAQFDDSTQAGRETARDPSKWKLDPNTDKPVLDAFNAGAKGSEAKALSPQLAALDAPSLTKHMDELALAPGSNWVKKPGDYPEIQPDGSVRVVRQDVYQNDADGSVVRVKPNGDMHNPGETMYAVEMRNLRPGDPTSQDNIAFKLDKDGQPVAKGPSAAQGRPSDKLDSTKYDAGVAEAGHHRAPKASAKPMVPEKATGNAAAMANSSFRGDATQGQTGGKDVQKGVRNALNITGIASEAKTRTNKDGTLDVSLTLPPETEGGAGKSVPMKVHVVDPTTHGHLLAGQDGVAPAAFVRREDGTGYDVYVSSGTRPQDVSRALAHEVAEIRYTEMGGTAKKKPLSEGGSPTDVDAHDAGRLAELSVLLRKRDIDTQGKPDSELSEAQRAHRDRNNPEMDAILGELGLTAHTPTAKLKIEAMEAQAKKGLIPQATVDALKTHLAPQMRVDHVKMQERVNTFRSALFDGDADAPKVLAAMRGMNEHESRAFRAMAEEQLGMSPAELQQQVKGRLTYSHNAAEAMLHLQGDTYSASKAALANLTGVRADLPKQAGMADVDAKGGRNPVVQGLRSLADLGGSIKTIVANRRTDPAAAMDVLLGMPPADRERLIRTEPKLLETISGKIETTGPVREKFEALTAKRGDKQTPEQWQAAAQGGYLLAHVKDQLDQSGPLKKLRGNPVAGVADLDAVRGNPDLYKGMLDAAKKQVPDARSPREALEKLLTEPLRQQRKEGKSDDAQGRVGEIDAQIAQIRTKLDIGDLDTQSKHVIERLQKNGLPVANGMDLTEVAALAKDPAHTAAVRKALGGSTKNVDQLVKYADQRRALEHEQRAQEVMAALHGQRPGDLAAALTDDTAFKLRQTIDDRHSTDAEKSLAQWRLDQWGKDRGDLMAAIKQAGGGEREAADLVTDGLRGDGFLRRRSGSEEVLAARKKLLPTLAEKGMLDPHQQIFMSMVGMGADNAGVQKAMKGLTPEQATDAAVSFRRDFGDEYKSELAAARKAAEGKDPKPTDAEIAKDFLSRVIDTELTGKIAGVKLGMDSRAAFETKRLLEGDPAKIFDPERAAKLPAEERAKLADLAASRFELEGKLLRQSAEYEGIGLDAGKNGGLQDGSDGVKDLARTAHHELAGFMEKHKAALASGDPATWKQMTALKTEYESAVAHHDSVRTKALSTTSRMIGTASNVVSYGLTAATPFIGPAAPLIGMGLKAGTKLAQGAMPFADRNRDRTQRMVGLGTTALGSASSFLKLGTDNPLAGLGTSVAQTTGKRATEFAADWRNQNRHQTHVPGAFTDAFATVWGSAVSPHAPGAVKGHDSAGSNAVASEVIGAGTRAKGKGATAGADPSRVLPKPVGAKDIFDPKKAGTTAKPLGSDVGNASDTTP
jgi:hypothetical protein